MNILKFLSAFAVVALHCYTTKTGTSAVLIVNIVGFAVPVFFLISGFYSYFENDDRAMEKYKTRAVKLVKLLLLANILYLIELELINIFKHDPLWLVYSIPSVIGIKPLIRFLMMNVQIESHLWFIAALFYCYIMMMLLIRFKIDPKKLYKYIPLLLF